MMKIKVHKNFFLEAYHPLLASDYRYNILKGGAGSGKSYFLAQKLVLDLLQEKQKLLVVRQTYASMKDSVFAELVGAVNKMGVGQFVSIKTTPLELNFANGSQVIFKGGDDEQKLLSISGVDKVWIEEASEISQELFHQLELRLRGKGLKKQFFLSFNPISENHWLKREFFDNPKEDSYVLHTTYQDNKHLDESYVRTLLDMKERNYEKYRVYALGQWGKIGKRVLEDYHIENRPDFSGQSIFGLDFSYGGSDPHAYLEALVNDETKELHITKAQYIRGNLTDLSNFLLSLGLSKHRIVSDSANKIFLSELQQKGLRGLTGAQKGPDSVQAGLMKIKEYRLSVDPEASDFIYELESYSYQKDRRTGLYLDKPVDDDNHLIDALRYALLDFSPTKRNRSRVLSKDLLGL